MKERLHMKNRIIILTVVVLLVTLTGCRRNIASDKRAQISDAVKNFNLVLAGNPEAKVFHNELKHFGLSLEGGSKFEWTEDPSMSDADFSISIDAEEFIKAGLDVNKLGGKTFTFQDATGETPKILVHNLNISDKSETYTNYGEALNNLINQIPDNLSSLKNDGYILNIGQGFQVHWNGDQRANKDIAFIINAEDLVSAGLDVNKLSGWIVPKNITSNDKGIKLLKVYYLK